MRYEPDQEKPDERFIFKKYMLGIDAHDFGVLAMYL